MGNDPSKKGEQSDRDVREKYLVDVGSKLVSGVGDLVVTIVVSVSEQRGSFVRGKEPGESESGEGRLYCPGGDFSKLGDNFWGSSPGKRGKELGIGVGGSGNEGMGGGGVVLWRNEVFISIDPNQPSEIWRSR